MLILSRSWYDLSKIIEVYSKGERYDVLVDDDLEIPSKVYKRGNYYRIWFNGKHTLLHRWILGVTDRKIQVDHIDNDPKNNTTNNLRACSQTQNQQNIKHKGYCFVSSKNKFRAKITIFGKVKFLGYFDTKEEAQNVYRKAHIKEFKEYSPYYREMINK